MIFFAVHVLPGPTTHLLVIGTIYTVRPPHVCSIDAVDRGIMEVHPSTLAIRCVVARGAMIPVERNTLLIFDTGLHYVDGTMLLIPMFQP